MSDYRDATMIVATGMKKIGKTYRSAQEIESYMMDDPLINRKGRKVLIFDAQMEEAWAKYPTLYFDVDEPNELKRAQGIIAFAESDVVHARRIIPRKRDGRPMTATEMIETVKTIGRWYNNGLLMLEDINKYINHGNAEEILDMLISLRHNSIDLILHLQSMSKMTRNMWENTNYVRMHKQGDPIARFKNRVTNYELTQIAEYIVNNKYRAGDRYFCLYLSPLDEKLVETSDADFKQACYQFLQKHKSELTQMLDMEDLETGKKLYNTRTEAANAWIQDRMHYITP